MLFLEHYGSMTPMKNFRIKVLYFIFEIYTAPQGLWFKYARRRQNFLSLSDSSDILLAGFLLHIDPFAFGF